MRTRAKIAGVCLTFAVAGASQGARGQVQDCSVKAERYSQFRDLEAQCQPMTGADRTKCDTIIRNERARLNSLFAHCGAGGGSKSSSAAGGSTPITPGPITAGHNAAPQSQALANAGNTLLGVLQQQQDEKNAREAKQQAAQEQKKKEELEAKRAEEARAEAAEAAMLLRKQAEMSALAETFNLAPESANDPTPLSKAARELCRMQGSYIKTMNPERYAKQCPAMKRPETPAGLEAVPFSVTPPAAGTVWSARACSDYSKRLHTALVAVARQHDAEVAACETAVAADPPVPIARPHQCAAVHAPGVRSVVSAMDRLSAAAIATINANLARPMAQRSGCSQHLQSLLAATSGIAFSGNRLASVLEVPPTMPAPFPPEEDLCQNDDGPLHGMSVTSTSPDVDGACRAVEEYWNCMH